jgi:hypothetical protein
VQHTEDALGREEAIRDHPTTKGATIAPQGIVA